MSSDRGTSEPRIPPGVDEIFEVGEGGLDVAAGAEGEPLEGSRRAPRPPPLCRLAMRQVGILPPPGVRRGHQGSQPARPRLAGPWLLVLLSAGVGLFLYP